MSSHQADEDVVLRTLAREGGRLQFSRLTYDGILAAAGRATPVCTGKQAEGGDLVLIQQKPGSSARAAPQAATEVWTYGGVRVGQGGKRAHAWLDASGEELLFSRAGARMAVGSQYTVGVSRHRHVTLHGTPAYAGSAADEATRRAVWAEHTVAQTRLEMIRAERNDARRRRPGRGPRPAAGAGRPARTSAERDALAAYIIRKLHNAWNPK